MKRSLISEPKSLVTGVEGAGKTLFCVQQADLLTRSEGGSIFQVNIRGADPAHLPKLPFPLSEMAVRDGKPVVDPETGDELPRWAVDLEPGTVVIVDEAHKVYPQRGPGRPPKHIEMLAEGRQHGIRFIFMSQQPDSMDAFVRGRINRHYHLERKGNLNRATILEFDHCVLYPQTAWAERKNAQVHFWKYPKEYFGWYQSAKSHHFRLRIPLKIVAALLFVPVAAFFIWKLFHSVSPVMHGITSNSKGASPAGLVAGASVSPQGEGQRQRIRYASIGEYSKWFTPLNPSMPWSAQAFQDREISAHPEIYCMASGAGVDAQGKRQGESCSCVSEQGTPITTPPALCSTIARGGGVYNPYREPRQSRNSGFSGGEQAVVTFDESSRPVVGEASGSASSNSEGQGYGTLPGYGGMGVASPK